MDTMTNDASSVAVVVFGGSGDIASRKTYPAIWRLFLRQKLPQHFQVVSYARSDLSRDDYISRVCKNIKPKDGDQESKLKNEFLPHFTYFRGAYDKKQDFESLAKKLQELEGEDGEGGQGSHEEPKDGTSKTTNRIFYLGVPPSEFADVSIMLHQALLSQSGFNRLIVEKPIGRDQKSAEELIDSIGHLFNEDDVSCDLDDARSLSPLTRTLGN
jgi:glucose-6-phosphate 1-dehydrogenase